MRYMVVGADKESGDDVEVTLLANTQEEAEFQAVGRGILVATITPLPDALNRLPDPPLPEKLPDFSKPNSNAGKIILNAQSPADSVHTYDGQVTQGAEPVAAMEYHIISNQALYLLETAVNKHIKDGWEPQGGVCVGISNNALVYFQAVVRHKK
ncbi:MAG TPA: hypothetical protein VH253_02380 [Phycisphaerae bacterium]|nr:hypothetical protein [Phycisphaerae bacterium]